MINLARWVMVVATVAVFFGCKGEPKSYFLPDGYTVESALDSAARCDKYLYVAFGDGKDCGATKAFIEKLNEEDVLKTHSEKYLFLNTSIADSSPDAIYKYIFIPPTIPNAYVFDKEGSVILISHHGNLDHNFLDVLLTSALGVSPVNPMEHDPYKTIGVKLLRLFNLLIDAAREYNRSNGDVAMLNNTLEILKQSIDMEDTFYGRYLQAMVYKELQNDSLSNISSTRAIDILYEIDEFFVYSELYQRLQPLSEHYSKLAEGAGKIIFEKSVVDFKSIDFGGHKEIVLPFENRGLKSVVILEAIVSCQCVEVEYPKEAIMPGQKSQVKLIYRATSKGPFLKRVTFKNSGAEIIIPITLEGEVK